MVAARTGEAPVSDDKVKGPASYFPSIEKKHGKPIGHWLAILDRAKDMKHMEAVAMLKSEHGMGHGHANALVAHHRASAGA
ncbi:hypothetical protein ASG87_05835 [Frateuria sp. Soil773]|uniref:DUF4287 domain-containing protein n=1 Tax=Frateuria sp. Soil773 TaxID=1736407 RepID=UPI0006F71A91|nr:DUF4287 domain-containing protein [Frateuria sp. Soil773]KRE89063.1 hypothetical protein ASG87_05835 [Frateuria sp. Soil773]